MLSARAVTDARANNGKKSVSCVEKKISKITKHARLFLLYYFIIQAKTSIKFSTEWAGKGSTMDDRGKVHYCPSLLSAWLYTIGRCCETALSKFADTIERNILRGKRCLAVSLDCSSAFDIIKCYSAREREPTRRGAQSLGVEHSHEHSSKAVLGAQ